MKVILFVGLNLRLEIPVLNSKFLRYSTTKFYSIGSISSYSMLKIKNMGNSLHDLVSILKGKSRFNSNIFSTTFFSGAYSNMLKPTSVYFVIGQSFYTLFNSFFLYDFCKAFLSKFFNNSSCLNLFNNVGVINSLLYGFGNVQQHVKASNSFVFLESVDESLFLNKMDFLSNEHFVVYKGCFF